MASYDPNFFSFIFYVLRRSLDAKSLLPAAEFAILSRPAALALNSEELESLNARHAVPNPYRDPALRQPVARKDFLRRFAGVGLLCGCEVVDSQVGFFFVKKKGGQQRLIVDARKANHLMRLPPKTRLGYAAAMAELRLSD